ncbi:uncharacterized protein LAESUDRAFT_205482 [Laetiporus sulphureus 93-53]|uniref:Uncharacterized protein n=1 Tax=Laetiporus sulphureus 93-53 TaxID=1314785 RepID=A0A165DYU3_9APHY|nr:uncharacterized protein LAESUDRAFT_205482 [Laetiporus sulphureus 93-53]KZT05909.1 hypothetical protein LAESUDRAFT_205482 [Laetiporus sulphureus 93-53]
MSANGAAPADVTCHACVPVPSRPIALFPCFQALKFIPGIPDEPWSHQPGDVANRTARESYTACRTVLSTLARRPSAANHLCLQREPLPRLTAHCDQVLADCIDQCSDVTHGQSFNVTSRRRDKQLLNASATHFGFNAHDDADKEMMDDFADREDHAAKVDAIDSPLI